MESIEIFNMPFGKLKKYCKGDAVCKGVIANGNYKCKFSMMNIIYIWVMLLAI